MLRIMELWKTVILEEFGKKAKWKWFAAALDFQLVDVGIKPACLFDHWVVASENMQAFTQDLYIKGLTKNKIHTLSIGQDIIIYSSCNSLFLMNYKSTCFVDISSSLLKPTLANEEKVCNTYNTLKKLCDIMNNIRTCQDSTHVYDVQISEQLNVPCLFGLLLGYPCVYWYDLRKGDEHCLSGEILHLFQVKGHLLTHTPKEKSMRPEFFQEKKLNSNLSNGIPTWPDQISVKHYQSENVHVIYSFTVPDDLLAVVNNNVKVWFQSWKELTCWSSIFLDVWLEEKTTSPQSVCL